MRPTLLLLPGLLCDRALWRHQIDYLADRADIVVADMTRADTMVEMARSVLAQAPPRFALAGLSMGGYCALEILRQAPQRVERLALLDTTARLDTPEQSQRRRDLMVLSERGEFKGVATWLLPLFIHASRLDDKALVDEIVAMTRRVGPEAFLRQQRAIMSRPDSRPHLPAISCPTLVLCGREDMLTPLAVHEEMAAAIPGARLVVIENSGHLPTLEWPQQVTQALRAWLDWSV
ncbi:MAG: alpha/beta fold hydrolase [Gammaproteobacteria bacterium]